MTAMLAAILISVAPRKSARYTMLAAIMSPMQGHVWSLVFTRVCCMSPKTSAAAFIHLLKLWPGQKKMKARRKAGSVFFVTMRLELSVMSL